MASELSELSKSEVVDRFNQFRATVRSKVSRAEEAAGEVQRKLVVGGVALLGGKYTADAQAQGVETFSVFGLSFEQTSALALTVAEFMTDDRDLKRLLGGGADAMIAVAAYQAGQDMQGSTSSTRTVTPSNP